MKVQYYTITREKIVEWHRVVTVNGKIKYDWIIKILNKSQG